MLNAGPLTMNIHKKSLMTDPAMYFMWTSSITKSVLTLAVVNDCCMVKNSLILSWQYLCMKTLDLFNHLIIKNKNNNFPNNAFVEQNSSWFGRFRDSKNLNFARYFFPNETEKGPICVYTILEHFYVSMFLKRRFTIKKLLKYMNRSYTKS